MIRGVRRSLAMTGGSSTAEWRRRSTVWSCRIRCRGAVIGGGIGRRGILMDGMSSIARFSVRSSWRVFRGVGLRGDLLSEPVVARSASYCLREQGEGP